MNGLPDFKTPRLQTPRLDAAKAELLALRANHISEVPCATHDGTPSVVTESTEEAMTSDSDQCEEHRKELSAVLKCSDRLLESVDETIERYILQSRSHPLAIVAYPLMGAKIAKRTSGEPVGQKLKYREDP